MVDGDDDGMLELAKRADVAAAEQTWEHQIADATVGGRRDDTDRQRLADAFRFHARHENGERFGPMVTFEGGGSVPAPLAEIPNETCELWEAVLVHAEHPRVRARLHDLLFERRWGEVGVHLAEAAEAYLEDAAGSNPPSLHAVDALRRTDHLARLGRKNDLLDRVTAEITRAAGASIDDAEPKPGVTLRLIEVLVDRGCADPMVDDLLDRARRRYPDAWNVQSTIELQRRRTFDDGRRKDLDRQLIERWLDEAESADPLVAVMHRDKAARLARQRGLPDLVDRAVVAMQTADRPELARIQIEVPSSITPEQIEEHINSMIGDSWWDSVMRVLSNGAPTGDVDRNRPTAADLAREHPLQTLLPKVRLGGDGLPRYSPQSEDDKLDDQLTDIEVIVLQWQGSMMAEALRRAGAAFGPTAEDMVEALGTVHCHGANAASIARAVRRFNDGDYEAAAYTGIPLVERQCRALLLAVDAPLYRVQRERAPGTYPGLGALLPQLAERGLDESWYRFLRTLLSAPNGWNLRNEALHGFVDDVDVTGAGLILIAGLYLILLHPRPAEATDAEPADDD